MKDEENRGCSRREFLGAAMTALWAGVMVQMTGCGYGNGLSAPEGDALGSIGDNHLHTARITKAQLDGGGELRLDITGTSAHPHFVTLTAGDMAGIKAGKPVSRLSTTDWGHYHWVHFNSKEL